MWALLLVLVTSSGMAFPTTVHVFDSREKCMSAAEVAVERLAPMPSVKFVGFQCVQMVFADSVRAELQR